MALAAAEMPEVMLFHAPIRMLPSALKAALELFLISISAEVTAALTSFHATFVAVRRASQAVIPADLIPLKTVLTPFRIPVPASPITLVTNDQLALNSVSTIPIAVCMVSAMPLTSA